MVEEIVTTGRRKTAVARVRLSEAKNGEGQIVVNGKDYKEYFSVLLYQHEVEKPLKLTESLGRFNIRATLNGGGVKGQAEALRLGIARALVSFNEEWHNILKENDLLKRDPRMVERKKPGRPKARKKFQFSKR
jgi:small subunit ribosomal protein S9